MALRALEAARSASSWTIEKGIPLGSGLGGSAASAVGGVVAANALLAEAAQRSSSCCKFAMQGEAVASGSRARRQHRAVAVRRARADGRHRQSARQADPGADRRVRCVLVHPHMLLSTTRGARDPQHDASTLSDFVWQTREPRRLHLRLLHQRPRPDPRVRSTTCVIEPQRQALIPGFTAVQAPRRSTRGALGCSISGAGPTVFAWCAERAMPSARARRRMVAAFARTRPRDRRTGSSPVGPPAPASSRVDADALHEHPRRRARRRRSARRSPRGLAPGRRPLRARRRAAASTRPALPRPLTLPEVGARLLAPFAAGEPLAPRARAICARRLQLPGAARGRASSADGALSRARAVPRPDGRVQGFRRALPRGVLAADAVARRDAAARSSSRPRATPAARSPRRSIAAPASRVVGALPGRAASRRAGAAARRAGATTCARFAVRGTFDDCQRMVKEAFADPSLRSAHELSSANSINLGRLLPQMVYYATSQPRAAGGAHGAPPIVHRADAATSATRVACLLGARSWACRSATSCSRRNANRTVPDFLATRRLASRAPSVATLASAMDVGNPSNMERLRAPVSRDVERAARRSCAPCSVDDDGDPRDASGATSRASARSGARTRRRRREVWRAAAARRAAPALGASSRRRIRRSSTSIVEPLIGRPGAGAAGARRTARAPSAATRLDAESRALRGAAAGTACIRVVARL